MSNFYRYQELSNGNRVEIVNLDDFMVNYRIPGDTITVDETWLQDRLKDILKKDHEIQKLKEQVQELENCNKRARNRINDLEITLNFFNHKTRILNTRI